MLCEWINNIRLDKKSLIVTFSCCSLFLTNSGYLCLPGKLSSFWNALKNGDVNFIIIYNFDNRFSSFNKIIKVLLAV